MRGRGLLAGVGRADDEHPPVEEAAVEGCGGGFGGGRVIEFGEGVAAGEPGGRVEDEVRRGEGAEGGEEGRELLGSGEVAEVAEIEVQRRDLSRGAPAAALRGRAAMLCSFYRTMPAGPAG